MKVSAIHKILSEVTEDVLIAPVFAGDTPRDGALAALDSLTRGMVAAVFENGEIEGKRDQWALLHNPGAAPARVLLYGAGAANDTSALGLQRLAGAAIRALDARNVTSAAFLIRKNLYQEASAKAIVEGAILGQMNGDFYRTNEKPARQVESLTLIPESPDAPDFAEAARRGVILAEAANLTRALGFEPGNVMTPSELARRAEEMAARNGLGVEVLGEEEMKRLGMGALLAVARGSAEPARLITLSYDPAGENNQPGGDLIALIGKGITFDSGGISIKPAKDMDEMKYDMGGGAAVIGAMQAIAQLKPAARVIGVVPASENLPSGRAVKPGDVARSLSGKTIEVANTDAEGRLILADAITYAISKGATQIVDAATLTGACVVALGEVRAAVMGSDQQLVDDLIRAGEQCGERLWQL
ncbi:MAG TPA: leucyl aminopeptidase, partial [Blastocatellia bacterium]|nr:leucyl aminopeptidase [Blastocatellia bacterium]